MFKEHSEKSSKFSFNMITVSKLDPDEDHLLSTQASSVSTLQTKSRFVFLEKAVSQLRKDASAPMDNDDNKQ